MEPAMERKKATDLPQELLNLFDRYVHGEITRRAFLDTAKKYAIGGLTALSIWESLRPNYALADQVAKDDKRLDRKSTRLNSSHQIISYAVFCLKKKKIN